MLEFSNDYVVGLVKIPITEADIENIIVSSFEGGSNNWLGVDNSTPEWKDKPKDMPISTWATKLLLERKTVKLYDIEEGIEWILTLQMVLNGIKQNMTERQSNKDTWDSTDADCIMQYAIFDEIIFD